MEPEGDARLILAYVDDVIKRDDSYFVVLHDWVHGVSGSYDIYFQMRCSADQTQYILDSCASQETLYDPECYALIIRAESVHKPLAELWGEVKDVPEDFAFVIHGESDILVIKGVCLDILLLPDVYLEMEDLFHFSADATSQGVQ